MVTHLTNNLRELVSKQKRRYKEDGFDLDLSYINDRIIAMGFPADNLEGVYRNNIDDVVSFLDRKHHGHYKVYNLCCERRYDKTKFACPVQTYGFEDHHPPVFQMIEKFCDDVHQWLATDAQNIAAIHCKAGKGRTGVMVCAYLLYSKQVTSSEEALARYGEKRTYNNKGVTVPSQIRYVNYFGSLLKHELTYTQVALRLVKVSLVHCPSGFESLNPVIKIYRNHQLHEGKYPKKVGRIFPTPDLQHQVHRYRDNNYLYFDFPSSGVLLSDDIRFDLCSKALHRIKREPVFQFWFNTFFVVYPQQTAQSSDGNYVLTLHKDEIDRCHKSKQFSTNFEIRLYFKSCDQLPIDSDQASSSTGADDASNAQKRASPQRDLNACDTFSKSFSSHSCTNQLGLPSTMSALSSDAATASSSRICACSTSGSVVLRHNRSFPSDGHEFSTSDANRPITQQEKSGDITDALEIGGPSSTDETQLKTQSIRRSVSSTDTEKIQQLHRQPALSADANRSNASTHQPLYVRPTSSENLAVVSSQAGRHSFAASSQQELITRGRTDSDDDDELQKFTNFWTCECERNSISDGDTPLL